MDRRFLLFLDFDGVICDSALECLVSSWLAYHVNYGGSRPDRVSVSLKRDFFSLRPFIRSGEDYVLIHELLQRQRTVGNQQDFDSFVEEAGPHKMIKYKKLFYEAREDLMRQDRSYWLALNPVYPHMAAALKRLSDCERLHIVSTKRPDFIGAILCSNGIDFTPERIHYSDKVEKIDLVADLLRKSGLERAVFVDDQIDHLRKKEAADPIEARLAAWGYVKPEWLDERATGVNVLTIEGMAGLFERLG
jgi:phosphoglycolate phosphatase-like HAD superfamily hydrolase